MAESCEGKVDTTTELTLICINLLITLLVALFTGMRLRAKCGCVEINTKPTNAPYSPNSAQATESPKHKSVSDSPVAITVVGKSMSDDDMGPVRKKGEDFNDV